MVGASSGMYGLKPLVKIEEPPTSSSSMYGMKRLFTPDVTRNNAAAESQSVMPTAQDLAKEDLLLKDLNEEEAGVLLKLRAEQITTLGTLDELRLQVEALKRLVGVDALPKDVLDSIEASLSSTAASIPCINDAVIRDIVVRAHPDRPPIAVLVYFETLKRLFKVTGSVHAHSSAGPVPKSLSDAFGTNGAHFASGISGGVSSRAAFEIAVTLIWKDVAFGTEMMIAPQRQTPILGDAAVCRYLARICQPYDADGCDAVQATELDTWVDAARASNEKEMASHVKSLSSRLSGTREWIVGNAVSLADVLNWALIRSSPFTPKQLPVNVENWRKRCEDRPEFQLAARVASHSRKR